MGHILKETYEENFGTACETCKQPVKEDSPIRLQGVKGYLTKRGDIQVKSKLKQIVLFLLVLNLILELILWIWNQKMLLLMPGMVLLQLITFY